MDVSPDCGAVLAVSLCESVFQKKIIDQLLQVLQEQRKSPFDGFAWVDS